MNNEQALHAMSIDDAYKVERVLARGPHGVTERVTIEGAGPFIRKKISAARANRAVWAALFNAECARLPQVAVTYEMPDCFVVVYDDVPGETLLSLVERTGALDAADAVQIALDLCEAALALHKCGVMHLDISPANIVLAADGAHLIDFGNARIIGARDVAAADGHPQGTWGFAAPEQFFSQVSERSDIYAMGRVLGYMLTGVCPDEDNLAAYEHALEQLAATDPALCAAVKRASHFEPGQRFQSAEEMAAALRGDKSCFDDSQAKEGFAKHGLAEDDFAEDDSSRACLAEDSTASNNMTSNGSAKDCFAASDSGNSNATTRDSANRSAIAGDFANDSYAKDNSVKENSATQASTKHSVINKALAIQFVIIAVLAIAAIGFVAAKHFASSNYKPAFNGMSSAQKAPSDDDFDEALLDEDDDSDSSFMEATSEEIDRAKDALKITESGWGVSNSGYVMYALTLENTSSDLTIEFPEIVITGRDKSGAVVFTEQQVLDVMYPGGRLTYSCQAGNGTAPAQVEFSIARPQEYQVLKKDGVASEFDVLSLTKGAKTYGTTPFTGEITCTKQGSEGEGMGEVWLSLVLRDEKGRIIYGENGFANRPAEGETLPFELQIFDCPAYATAEIVPMAW